MKPIKLIPDNTNIKFLRWRVPIYSVSILLMAASIALVFVNGLNLGGDLIGGQSIRVTFSQETAPVAEVREEIDALGYVEPIIQQVGPPNQFTIGKMQHEETASGFADLLMRDVRTAIEANPPKVEIGSARAV